MPRPTPLLPCCMFMGMSGALCLAALIFSDSIGFKAQAAEQSDLKVSSFAKAADLDSAQKYFLAQLEESFAVEADYAEDIQERVKKNALVLAIIAQTLEQDNTYPPGKSTPSMVRQFSVELASNVKDYKTSKAIFEKLHTAATSTVPSPMNLANWQVVRGQGAIMKKTNELNSAIKRNLTPARFEKQAEALKYQTATMTAIGQATLLDTHEVKNPADLPTYEKYAVEFRTAAAELNKAVHAADQAAALKAFARMDASCHTCHQKFDPPKK
jgi:cytochrome c556